MREAATVLQIIGIVVMGFGVWRTYRDFGPPGGMIGPFRTAIGRAWQPVARVARELVQEPLGSPPP